MERRISTPQHPLFAPICFISRFQAPLGQQETPSSILAYFGDKEAPLAPNDEVKTAVRKLLRHGGFQPSGRSKPASEYLRKAIEKGWFTPTKGINVAVDICNVVSLHSGIPISVIDLHRSAPPQPTSDLSFLIAPEGTSYPFNASEQVIKLDGLLCLQDTDGPCASPVKDSHRTKTTEETTKVLTIIWGTNALKERIEATHEWYLDLLTEVDAEIIPLTVETIPQ